MKLSNRIPVIGAFAILLSMPGAARAELGEDTHIQESGEIRIEVDRQVFESFARMLEMGYPPATIMMHAVSTGMSINDILYIAVKSDVDRAREYYDTAESLLPALPGWVCQANRARERYTKTVDLSELGDAPTIRNVARLFFEDNRRVAPFPKWPEGKIHMEASAAELADLVSDEQWYVPGEDDGTPRTAPNRPVFVSLYRHNGGIVVDSGFDRIRRAQEQGVERLPVVLVYNDSLHRPISGFAADVTVRDLADEFYGEGIQLTAVPEWQVGDHHKSATVDELRDLVDVPDREDIEGGRWEAVEQEIRANGMALPRPLLLTLVRSGQGNAWVGDPTTVAVAADLGIQNLPVVLFYHDIDRQACGQTSSCQDMLCEAATAAGASEEICDTGEEQTTAGAETDAPANLSGTDIPIAPRIDPRLYSGLSYTQNQCTS